MRPGCGHFASRSIVSAKTQAGTLRRSPWNSSATFVEMDTTIDLQITGFEMGEIDVSLDGAGIDEEDELPPEQSSPVTQLGDLWIAGEHRIFCGDALKPASYAAVLWRRLRRDGVLLTRPITSRSRAMSAALGRQKTQ